MDIIQMGPDKAKIGPMPIWVEAEGLPGGPKYVGNRRQRSETLGNYTEASAFLVGN
jgi:hypothetical protein